MIRLQYYSCFLTFLQKETKGTPKEDYRNTKGRWVAYAGDACGVASAQHWREVRENAEKSQTFAPSIVSKCKDKK